MKIKCIERSTVRYNFCFFFPSYFQKMRSQDSREWRAWRASTPASLFLACMWCGLHECELSSAHHRPTYCPTWNPFTLPCPLAEASKRQFQCRTLARVPIGRDFENCDRMLCSGWRRSLTPTWPARIWRAGPLRRRCPQTSSATRTLQKRRGIPTTWNPYDL